MLACEELTTVWEWILTVAMGVFCLYTYARWWIRPAVRAELERAGLAEKEED